MNRSESIANIAKALAAARANFGPVTKNQKANAGKYAYDYADLALILSAVDPALAAAEIAPYQSVKIEGQKCTVTTTLLHSSGEWIESDPLTLSAADDRPQSLGSCATYARRYSLVGVLGVSPASEDDDANVAQGNGEQVTTAPRRQAASPEEAAMREALAKKLKAKFPAAALARKWAETQLGHEVVSFESLSAPDVAALWATLETLEAAKPAA